VTRESRADFIRRFPKGVSMIRRRRFGFCTANGKDAASLPRRARVAASLVLCALLGLVSIPAWANLGLSHQFIVSGKAVDEYVTAVGYNPYAREHLVVWSSTATGDQYEGDIFAARVSWDGRVLSSFQVSASSGAGDKYSSVTFDTVYDAQVDFRG
jgi:hypothetical protein